MGNNGINEPTKRSPPEEAKLRNLYLLFLFVSKQALTLQSHSAVLELDMLTFWSLTNRSTFLYP